MNLEDKLQRFSDEVKKEALEKNKQLLSEVKGRYDKNIEEFDKKSKAKYEQMAQEAEINGEKLKQKRITEANTEIKKGLIAKRAEYARMLFVNIDKRLEEFFKTDDYEKLLVKIINDHKDLGTADMRAQIMRRDEHLKEALEKDTGVKIDVVDMDFLGGTRILLGNNRIADFTFSHRYDAQKSGFNKIRIS